MHTKNCTLYLLGSVIIRMGSLELGLTAEHNYSSYLNCHLPAVCSGQFTASQGLVQYSALQCSVVQLYTMYSSQVH